MLSEVLHILDPQPGMVVVDCTVGWAGHSVEILKRLGPTGMLIGLDMDAENLPKAQERLEPVSRAFQLHHSNFAGLLQVLATHSITQVDGLLADLGMSSMQVDDAERGFSYRRDGPLDVVGPLAAVGVGPVEVGTGSALRGHRLEPLTGGEVQGHRGERAPRRMRTA
jgi:16S rRNA (cytosine1402-N4)-methyltransferase